MTTPASAKAFLGWLSQFHPEAHARLVQSVPEAAAAVSVPAHMEGLGQDPTVPVSTDVPWWQKIMDVAGGIAGSYFENEAQKDIYKYQIELAERGYPPTATPPYYTDVSGPADVPPTVYQPPPPPAPGNGIPMMPLLAIGGGLLLLMMFAMR